MSLYHGYDRAALDGQYNNRLLVPDFQTHFDRWKTGSDAARQRFQGLARYDLAYGPTRLENLDVYPAKAGPGAKPPILVFIHGGYWRLLDKSTFAFTAPPYVDAGITYIPINYDLIPAVTIDQILAQVRAAITWLYRNPEAHGGDLNRLYVSGHSAGGQLAPMAMIHDWKTEGLPADAIKGAVAISGIYDLEAMRRCYLNEGMNLDDGMVQRNSPIHQVPPASRPQPPLVLSVGALESAEFHRQQADFAKAWARSQAPARVVEAPGANHFSAVEQFADPGSALFRATRDLVLGPGRTARV